MKLREPSPSKEPQGDWQQRTCPPGFEVKTFTVETITPIYGGGVTTHEPDLDMPIRAAAIRGQLRFWWRLLHRDLESEEMFKREREIWGGMSEEQQDHSSKVRIIVSAIPDRDFLVKKLQPCAEHFSNRNNKLAIRFLHGIHPYSLFPGQGKIKYGKTEKEPAKVLLPNISFTIKIIFQKDIWLEVEKTLRWWASFGGIGARTRRGLGSIRVDELEPVTCKEVEENGCLLILRRGKPNAIGAWKESIEKLHAFRQGIGETLGRREGMTKIRPGRSRWPEADTIRQITETSRIKPGGIPLAPTHQARESFPRAFFGMPIIFHFQGENSDESKDPEETSLVPEGFERFASPLILKAQAIAENKFLPIALLLPFKGLEHKSLRLDNSGEKSRNPNLPKILEPGVWWPEGKNALEKASKIAPLRDRNPHPLLAFLEYFKEGT